MNFGDNIKRLKLGEEQVILLICMGISLLFWFFVQMSRTYETIRPVKISYALPTGLDFAESPVNEVNATFSGYGWKLLSTYLFQKESEIHFDLSGYTEPEISNQALIKAISNQTRLEVVNVNPEFIPLDLDKTNVRKVPVILDSNLDMEQNYFILDSIRIVPDSVTVWGPDNALKDVSFVKTENLSISGLRNSQTRTLDLQMPEEKYLKLSAASVQVFIPVEQFTEKVFQVSVVSSTTPDSIQLIPSTVQLTCVVAINQYENTSAKDFTVEAIIPEKIAGQSQTIASLLVSRQPAWVRSTRIDPDKVEYFFVK